MNTCKFVIGKLDGKPIRCGKPIKVGFTYCYGHHLRTKKFEEEFENEMFTITTQERCN